MGLTPSVARGLKMRMGPVLLGLAVMALMGPSAAGQPLTSAATGTAPASQPATAAAPRPLEVVTAQAAQRGVTVATLSNGLTVIIGENHTTPVVCVQAFVRAGSMVEGPWTGSGLSHLLEHLVAKGAAHEGQQQQQSQQTRDRLDEIGAQSNAYTSLDQTAYFINATASRTDDAIAILADWMARPDITREDFLREHGVVQRELEMGKDEPQRQLSYAHMANFYGTHPAAVPTIGYRGALAAVTYEDVLAYHRQRYTPHNIVFVVVGDVDTAAVLRMACRTFTGFEAGPSTPVVLPEVPFLAGVRRVAISSPTVQEVTERLAFRTIPLVHPDLYALDVLSDVLTNGQSSRLYRDLVRQKQLMLSLDSSSYTPDWGAGQLLFSFRAEPAKVEQAEGELLAQLARVSEEGVSEEELAAAKRRKAAEFVYGQQSVESQAERLGGDFLSTGDVDFSRQYVDRIQAVTAEQVRQVARRYITPDAMAVTRLLPGEAAATQAATAATRRAGEATKFTLPNGLTVILGPTDSVDLVSMHMAVMGGVLAEDEKTNGLGTLMTELSLKGAAGHSADDIAGFFDRAGGSIEVQCGNNSFVWSATTLKDDAAGALQMLADVVIHPDWPAAELEILRPMVLSAIQRIEEDWFGQARHAFRQKFFTDSPYRLDPLGLADVVSKADVKAIAAHHQRWVKAGSAVLAIYGNFDPVQMRANVEKAFADLPGGAERPTLPPQRTVKEGGERYVVQTTNEQAAVIIGWPGMPITDRQDVDAMTVLDTLISGYDLPRGWLHEQLRGAQLVYVVHATNWTGLAPGTFMVYAGTQPDKAAQVTQVIRRNVERTLTYDWPAQDITQAVDIILTSQLLDRQTMSALAVQAALDELYGLGYDYQRTLEQRLRAVTAEDIKRVARKYLAGPAVELVTTPQPQAVPQP